MFVQNNPIMQMLGGGINNNPGMKYMMQAFSAMRSGQSPQQFLQGLVGSVPQLQGLDLNNLQSTADMLCKKNNIDQNKLTQEITEFANSNNTQS